MKILAALILLTTTISTYAQNLKLAAGTFYVSPQGKVLVYASKPTDVNFDTNTANGFYNWQDSESENKEFLKISPVENGGKVFTAVNNKYISSDTLVLDAHDKVVSYSECYQQECEHITPTACEEFNRKLEIYGGREKLDQCMRLSELRTEVSEKESKKIELLISEEVKKIQAMDKNYSHVPSKFKGYDNELARNGLIKLFRFVNLCDRIRDSWDAKAKTSPEAAPKQGGSSVAPQ